MENDKSRIDSLCTYITSAIDKMVAETSATGKKKRSSKSISNQITGILTVSLDCEREHYIEKLTEELNETNQRNSLLEQKILSLKEKYTRSNAFLQDQNNALLKKSDDLENKLRTVTWKKMKRTDDMKELIRNQNLQIQSLKSALQATKECQQYLLSDLAKIREKVTTNLSRQQKFLQKAHQLMKGEINESFQSMMNSVNEETNQSISIVKTNLSNEQHRIRSLEDGLTILFTAIRSIAPEGVSPPNLTVSNFIAQLPEVQKYLLMCVEKSKLDVLTQTKQQIKTAVPQIDFSNGKSISEAVSEYLQGYCSREESMRDEMERLERKVAEMKQKLEDAMLTIKRMSRQSIDPETEIEIDDTIFDKDEWDSRKKRLDDTINKLYKISGQANSPSLKLPDLV